jgi:hypothetical protein
MHQTHPRSLPSNSFVLFVTSIGFLVAAVLVVGRADPAAGSTMTFDAGVACTFPLQIDSTGAPQVNKTFEAPDGSVRVLSAGKGSDLVFTNLETGDTYALSGNGAVQWTRVDADGSARITLTGHNIVIYFPNDTPRGPSTTLVVGREVIAVDLETFQFTRLSRAGRTTEICAALT